MSIELIEALPLPALLIGPDERVQASNTGARRLFGPALTGRHYITVLRQPTLLDAVETALAKGVEVAADYLGTEARRDMTWSANIAPIEQDAGRSLLVTFEDRTLMHEAGQMRRDFVANVSHELKTPLTALIGFIETLKGAARDDAAARGRFLSIMEREASRMDRLVSDLLSLSRVESEERIRPTKRVDLAALVRSAVNTLTPIAQDAGVSLTTHGLDDAVTVPGDADQLSQVATNLIENAVKYSGKDSAVRVTLERMAENSMVRGPAAVLTVTDTGEGIAAVHIPRLTERFYRIDAHRSREKGGTGLGLAIVKHIVNRHRGRLRIESEMSKGSTFSVILPEFPEVGPPS